MKEWIYKDGSGQYVLTTDTEVANLASDAIEVPYGAEAYINIASCSGRSWFYRLSEDPCNWKNGIENPIHESYKNIDKFTNEGDLILWKREKESLNDQVLAAEVARQNQPNQKTVNAMREAEGILSGKHSHYKKDVSHLNVVDPYRIADLYNLHPCAEHIMKKSLCAGNRGHKDKLRDIQDIIDTAERWKQMIKEDNNEI